LTKRKPYSFKLHIDHLENPDKDVWAVQWNGHYFTATEVRVFVPVCTVFKGMQSKQPRAYLVGRGVVRRTRLTKEIVITED
jgi:hypothetical protein